MRAVALLALLLGGCKEPMTQEESDERRRVHLEARATACRGSCETAGLCVDHFKPWESTFGNMECDCGTCPTQEGSR